VTAPLYAVYGLSIGAIGSVLITVAYHVGLAGLWLFYRYLRGGRDGWALSEVICVLLLMIMFTNIASPSQYLAVAMDRPLIDPWLAAADAAFGVHVPSLTAWTAQYPALTLLLRIAYKSLLIQFVGTAILLGMVYRNLERLWEYAFHFHFCLVFTAVSLAIFPAECAFTFYGFESLLDQTRFIRQFEGFRSGAMTEIVWNDLEGMISMPSFHVAGGLMVTWVLRGHRRLLPIALLLNLGMVAATVLCGAHYFIDLVATGLLFGLSVFCYKRWASRGWQAVGPSPSPDESG